MIGKRWPSTFPSLLHFLLRQGGEIVFVLSNVLLVLFPLRPWNAVNPGRDSGVFLYIGWRILNGELPYRDVWDHKPPIIFYLNALGVALSGNSRGGIWVIELIFVFLAAWIGFRILSKIFGTPSAILATFLWMLSLEFVIQGGNLTTEYTLLFQFASLALIQRMVERSSPWIWFGLGILSALAFFTKQNTIGIGIAALIYLVAERILSRKSRELWKEMGLFALGGAIVSAAIFVFFATQGAFSDFWNAAFKYNFWYASHAEQPDKRWRYLLTGIEPLTITGLFQIALIGYVIGFLLVCFKSPRVSRWLPFFLIGILDFPLEFILANMTGRRYPHYYMALLPILAIFSGVVFWVVFSLLKEWLSQRIALPLIVIGSLLAFGWGAYAEYTDTVRRYSGRELASITKYVRKISSPDDFVLMWGAETVNNFLAPRRSPTRFVYQYPLYAPGYTTPEMVEEFLDDILRTHPIIIDTRNPLTPMYKFPVTSEKIQATVKFLQAHYCLEEEGENASVYRWAMYRYHEEPCTGETP
ncbi:MAG: ArnT family glycosyltransferase [Anaerolineales bacterium]